MVAYASQLGEKIAETRVSARSYLLTYLLTYLLKQLGEKIAETRVSGSEFVECPICGRSVAFALMNQHIDRGCPSS